MMMKRLMLVAVAAAMLSSGSGCYLLDHVFACCHGGCGPNHGGCNDCDSCGGCDTCGGGCGGGCATGGCADGCGGCASCGMGGGPGGPGSYVSGPDDSMGGVVTYPYYSVRGPRDYLAKTPRSVGP